MAVRLKTFYQIAFPEQETYYFLNINEHDLFSTNIYLDCLPIETMLQEVGIGFDYLCFEFADGAVGLYYLHVTDASILGDFDNRNITLFHENGHAVRVILDIYAMSRDELLAEIEVSRSYDL